MKNLGFFVWAVLVLCIILLVYSRALKRLVGFKQAAQQATTAANGSDSSGTGNPAAPDATSETGEPGQKPDPKRQGPLADLPLETYPFLNPSVTGLGEGLRSTPQADDSAAAPGVAAPAVPPGPQAEAKPRAPSEPGVSSANGSDGSPEGETTQGPDPSTSATSASPDTGAPGEALAAEFAKLQRTEAEWKDHPPQGYYIVRLRDMYRGLGRDATGTELAERVRQDVDRLQQQIEGADALCRDLLRRERSQADPNTTWVLELMREAEAGMQKYPGTPGRRRLTTLRDRWKSHNAKSLELFEDLKDRGHQLQQRNQPLKSLLSSYRSLAKRYPGTEGAVAASKEYQRLEEALTD